ncbi:MAG: hypothetical protein IT379_14615 [Deltaproteobacteria bacterium]|nr:hypothetical protein [Deltaproteobacteria bacterium]
MELCGNMLDDDCTGGDQLCPPSCMDLDGDGYGTGATCLGPDCNDSNPTQTGVEVCDGVDNDCDSLADEGVATSCVDYASCATVALCGSCPTAPAETCGDGRDNDCDMMVDEGCSDPCGVPAISFAPRAMAPFFGQVRAAAGVDGVVRVVRSGGHFAYDPVANSWALGPPVPSDHTFGDANVAVAVAEPGRLFVFPSNDGATPRNELAIFTTSSGSWSWSATVDSAHRGGAAALIGGEAIFLGAWAGGVSGTPIDLVDGYVTAMGTWRSRARIPGPAEGTQGIPGYAVVGGSVYLLGGFNESPGLPTARVSRYDAATDAWSARAALPTPRSAPGAFARGTIIYVLGGFTGSRHLDDVVAYDTVADRHCVMSIRLPTPMSSFGVATVGSRVFLVGGDGDGGGLSSTIEVL